MVHTTSQSPKPNQVEITLETTYEAPEPIEKIDVTPEGILYTEDELYCLAAIIYNEAGGDACTDEQRRMVGYVVLNRVNDYRFPDSIRGVIEAPGQYQGMGQGVYFLDRGNPEGEAHAIQRAYSIARELLENRHNIPIPSNVLFQAAFAQGVGVYTIVGNTYFCYASEVN